MEQAVVDTCLPGYLGDYGTTVGWFLSIKYHLGLRPAAKHQAILIHVFEMLRDLSGWLCPYLTVNAVVR